MYIYVNCIVSKTNTANSDTFVPHEYCYLNKSVLDTILTSRSEKRSHSHFSLMKPPRATSQLRVDVLQRGMINIRFVWPCVCVLGISELQTPLGLVKVS